MTALHLASTAFFLCCGATGLFAIYDSFRAVLATTGSSPFAVRAEAGGAR